VTRARRPSLLFLRLEETTLVNVAALREGDIDVRPSGRLVVLSILTGREHPLTGEELELLLAIPASEWVEPPPADEEVLEGLVRRGLVLTDERAGPYAELRHQDELLAAYHWHPHAALFHAMTKWRDVEVVFPVEVDGLPPAGELDAGDPAPPPFAELPDARTVALTLTPRSDGLFGTLARRRTTRSFDPAASLTEDQLSTLLYEVYGCRGTLDLDGEHVALRKASPSGGGLHPTEVYPLLLRVEGIEPGLYHYQPRDHTLELVTVTTREDAEALVGELTCGQMFLASCGALFIMTARFDRSFWKYRRHARAYATLLLDAGHLSQTLYLVATELGLGAFVTGAINGANVEERLGLDPVEEGAIAICACGVPAGGQSRLEPVFVPYVPGRPA
jgi:putative peptide maturation dehydrogenase